MSDAVTVRTGDNMLSLLQASRFFAAVIVVLDHASVTAQMPRYYDRILLNGLFGAGRYGVDFFFVLSGFIISYAHWDDVKPGALDPGARLQRFAKRRFVRIYPTYWIVLSVTLLPLYFTANRYDVNIKSPWYILNIFTLFQGNGNILTSAWTLTHEVLFYILFGLVIWRRNLGVVLLAGWFLLSSLSYTVAFPSNLLAHPEHLGFLFGMVGCYLTRTAEIPLPRATFLLGLAGFAACCVLAGYFQTAGDLNDVLDAAAARGPLLPLFLCSTLMVIGLVEMERSEKVTASAGLRLLGDASYAIYLVHFPVLVIAIKLVHDAQIERVLSFPLLFAAVSTVAILTGIVFHLVVEKPLLATLNQAFGAHRQSVASVRASRTTLAPAPSPKDA